MKKIHLKELKETLELNPNLVIEIDDDIEHHYVNIISNGKTKQIENLENKYLIYDETTEEWDIIEEKESSERLEVIYKPTPFVVRCPFCDSYNYIANRNFVNPIKLIKRTQNKGIFLCKICFMQFKLDIGIE